MSENCEKYRAETIKNERKCICNIFDNRLIALSNLLHKNATNSLVSVSKMLLDNVCFLYLMLNNQCWLANQLMFPLSLKASRLHFLLYYFY